MVHVVDRRPAGPARILSFETFVRRSFRAPEESEQDGASESPFSAQDWARPLNARQILHRQAMLRHFERQA